MIPFTFINQNGENYKVGVFLIDNDTGRNILTPNNFVFYGAQTYSPAIYYLLVPKNQNLSVNLSVTVVNKLEDNYTKAVLDNGKKVNVVGLYHYRNFIELDENNEIMYPFKSIAVSFSLAKGLDCKEKTKGFEMTPIPIYAIEEGSLIQRIKDLTDVDICPIIRLYKEKKPKSSVIYAGYLENYILAYKSIPEFRKCVENNIGEIKDWVKYSLTTIKNKSKKMNKLLENKGGSSLPAYVKSYMTDNNVKDGEKNILELYNLGFTEDDFSLCKKLIGSFANTYVQRFLSLYDFVNDNNRENPQYSVSEVLKMTGKNKTASRKFFTQFNSVQSNFHISSKYSLLDITELEEMIKSSIVNRTFVENLGAIRTEIENFDKKTEEYSLRQYPQLTIPDDFFEYDFDIYRLKDIKDIVLDQERKMWYKLLPWNRKLKEGEIVFFVKKDDEPFMGIVNLINQRLDLYCLQSYRPFINPALVKIVDKNEPCGYFNEHLDTNFLEKLQSCLSKYFYEPFAKIRLKSLLSA